MENQQLTHGVEFDFEGLRFVINSVRHNPLGKVYFTNKNDEQEEYNMQLDVFNEKIKDGYFKYHLPRNPEKD